MYNNKTIILFFLLSALIPFMENAIYFLIRSNDLSLFANLTIGTVDYYYFWGVGRFINLGHISDLTNFELYKNFLQHNINNKMYTSYWAYPPTINFLICFIALFPYFIGYIIWNFIGLSLFYFACKKYTKNNLNFICILLTSPFLLIAFHYGQTSIIIASLIMLGLYFNKFNSQKINFQYDHSMLSGLLFGLSTIKYPFVLLIPIYLLLTKSYKTLFYMILTSIIMIVLSILCFGLQAWLDYFYILAPWMMHDIKISSNVVAISPLGVMHTENIQWNIAWFFQIIIMISSIIFLFICILKKYFINKIEQDIFLLSMILYVTPYAHIYDMVVLSFPLLYTLHKAYILNKKIYVYILSFMWLFFPFIDWMKLLYSTKIYVNFLTICITHNCTVNLLLMLFLTLTIFLLRDHKDKTLIEKNDL
jgi:hypothetical protein